MIRFIRAKSLADLRSHAALVPSLRQAAAGSETRYREAAAARAAAEEAQAQAEARYDAVANDTAASLVRLWELADNDPKSARAVQAEIALEFLRRQIAEAKASGDPALTGSVRVLDTLIGTDGPHATADALRALHGQDRNAREDRQ